jgi:DNA-binding transcriptional regulator YhcF (GntR family)
VPRAKIQLGNQFAIDRRRAEPLSMQIVRQLQEAIETGHVARDSRLPSTRALARTLGVSRNTAIAAYEELAARGFVRSRRGAGLFACEPPGLAGFNMRAVMRDAQYPTRTLSLRDSDGNHIYIVY